MKLLEMELENFRQFYGTQGIDFATGEGGSNITVFHGFNGSGKTALLNSFIWCLYGETTPDLEAPERLENEGAVAEAVIGSEIRVAVSLRFEMHGEVFRVSREKRAVKDGANTLRRTQESLSLWKVKVDGEFETVGNSDAARQKRLEQILPKSLYPFFFFNGERVEHLASPEAYDRVEAGVKTLLDIEVYERGARHLRGPVSSLLTTELRRYGDAELQEAAQELESLSKELESLEEDKQLRIQNAAALSEEIDRIEKQQSSIAKIHELAKERDRLRREESRLNDEIGDMKRDIAGALSRDGYLAFVEPVLMSVSRQIDDARKKGEIPAKIKPQFVDDLLEKRECICGRSLDEDSPEEERLKQWRSATGLAEFEERISQLGAMIAPLRARRAAFFDELDRYSQKLQRAYASRTSVREQLSVVEENLGDPGVVEDAAQLQEQIRKRKREREQENAHRLIAEEKLGETQQKLDNARRAIKRLQVQDKKAQLIQRQLEAVERVADALRDVARIQKDDVRESLDGQIKTIWNEAAIKDYVASVTEDYRLLLTKMVGGQRQPVHGASTGEKQVLALSFVGSLVHKARDNAGKSHGINVGGHYPLVMDSPFGSLEDDYRASVAEWVPSLADQVIVMVSKSQWRNEVERAMHDKVGRQYVLELHTPKEGAARTIEINGVHHPYVVSTTNPIERTMIRGV